MCVRVCESEYRLYIYADTYTKSITDYPSVIIYQSLFISVYLFPLDRSIDIALGIINELTIFHFVQKLQVGINRKISVICAFCKNKETKIQRKLADFLETYVWH